MGPSGSSFQFAIASSYVSVLSEKIFTKPSGPLAERDEELVKFPEANLQTVKKALTGGRPLVNSRAQKRLE